MTDDADARLLIHRWMPRYEGGQVLAFLDAQDAARDRLWGAARAVVAADAELNQTGLYEPLNAAIRALGAIIEP